MAVDHMLIYLGHSVHVLNVLHGIEGFQSIPYTTYRKFDRQIITPLMFESIKRPITCLAPKYMDIQGLYSDIIFFFMGPSVYEMFLHTFHGGGGGGLTCWPCFFIHII